MEKKHKPLIVAIEKKQLKSDFVWGSTCQDRDVPGQREMWWQYSTLILSLFALSGSQRATRLPAAGNNYTMVKVSSVRTNIK